MFCKFAIEALNRMEPCSTRKDEETTADPSPAAPHDIGWLSFVVSHLSGKNKNAAKVGHPGSVIRCHFSAATRCASGAAQDDSAWGNALCA
jgi:hypothetical protein